MVGFRTPLTYLNLRPIATSTLYTLEINDPEAVLKTVTFRQIAIKIFIHQEVPGGMELLLQVFEKLTDLENATIGWEWKW